MPEIKFSKHILMSTALIIPALVVGNLSAAYFLIWPKYKSVQESKARLEQKLQDKISLQSDLAGVRDLLKNYKAKNAILETVDETIPNAPRIPELLANLDYLTEQSGLLMVNVKLEPLNSNQVAGVQKTGTAPPKRLQDIAGKSRNLGIIEIKLTAKGKYQNFKIFLANLEQNLRLMDTHSLTLGIPDEGSGTQEFGLIIQTYYQKSR